MYPTALRQLLADPAFGPNRVQDAADISDRWFATAASLASFVCRSIFRDLIVRGWADPQGVPTADWTRFTVDVLPRMVAVLDALPSEPVPELRDLVLHYHSSI
jgi:hypothetical protein